MPNRKPNKVVSICDGVATIDVSTRKFPNAVTTIDADNLYLITESPSRWYVKQAKNSNPYVARNIVANGKQFTELLHRVILGLVDRDDLGDHIGHDTLNNQRQNLRQATHSQNVRNQRSHRGSSSGYWGVSWCVRDRCWRAHCQTDGKNRSLGTFKTEIEAAKAYDAAMRNDPFANLNFAKIAA